MSEPMTATVPQADSGQILVPPQTIGRFTILNEIGRGSYGVVYAAHDPVLGREVAIKLIPLTPDEQFRTQIEANFLREAKSAGGMSHPSIVTVYDAGQTDAFAYIAMERLHGQDLHEYLVDGNRMSPRQAAAMMMRVADAIHYANKRGLVHRDIKPSNIFLSRDLKPKLLDFGTALAPVAEPAQRGTRQLVGTPNYMSPEQARGAALDARSDIFSLGTILYELLSGRRAFDGRTIDETLDSVLTASPKPLDKLRPDTPLALLDVVRKAMAKAPSDRFQKASELRNALAEFVDGTRPGASDVSVATRPPVAAPSHRSPGRIALAVFALAVALIVIAAALRREPQPTPVSEAATPMPVIPPPAPPAPEVAPQATASDAGAAAKSETRPPARKRDTLEAAQPPSDGSLALAVSPWGEVFVNGEARGVSPPLTQLTLPAGVHSVEIRNSSSPPFIARVEVRPGEKIVLQHRF
jgi:serine/threonine protein kinase